MIICVDLTRLRLPPQKILSIMTSSSAGPLLHLQNHEQFSPPFRSLLVAHGHLHLAADRPCQSDQVGLQHRRKK